MKFLVRREIFSVNTVVSAPTAAQVGPPLDAVTIGCAYGFRLLRTAYAGECVRIRRSSDDAEDDFGFDVDGVVDTAAIATFIGGGSGFIVAWYDQSVNGFDFVQATAASQPQFIASSNINSLPAARFDGTNDQMAFGPTAPADVNDLVNSNEGTIFTVLHQTTTPGGAEDGLFAYGGEIRIFINAFDLIIFEFGSSAGAVSVAHPGGWDNAAHVLELYRTTGDVQAIVADGVELASQSETDTAAGGPFGNSFGQVGSQFMPADVAEFFILKTDIGSTDRSTIRANLGSYYSIAV